MTLPHKTRCPKCRRIRLQSHHYDVGTEIAKGPDPEEFNDGYGRYHRHDVRARVQTFECSHKHKFAIITYLQCPCAGCAWTAGEVGIEEL